MGKSINKLMREMSSKGMVNEVEIIHEFEMRLPVLLTEIYTEIHRNFNKADADDIVKYLRYLIYSLFASISDGTDSGTIETEIAETSAVYLARVNMLKELIEKL